LISVPAKSWKAVKFSATFAWMRAGRIASIVQYLPTTSRNSSAVTGLIGLDAQDRRDFRRLLASLG
jgi:hypothetical protein